MPPIVVAPHEIRTTLLCREPDCGMRWQIRAVCPGPAKPVRFLSTMSLSLIDAGDELTRCPGCGLALPRLSWPEFLAELDRGQGA